MALDVTHVVLAVLAQYLLPGCREFYTSNVLDVISVFAVEGDL